MINTTTFHDFINGYIREVSFNNDWYNSPNETYDMHLTNLNAEQARHIAEYLNGYKEESPIKFKKSILDGLKIMFNDDCTIITDGKSKTIIKRQDADDDYMNKFERGYLCLIKHVLYKNNRKREYTSVLDKLSMCYRENRMCYLEGILIGLININECENFVKLIISTTTEEDQL